MPPRQRSSSKQGGEEATYLAAHVLRLKKKKKKEPVRSFGNRWMFSELRNFLCRLKTNFRKQTQNGRQGFHGDGKNSRGTRGDLLTGSLAEILLKKIFVFHLPALALQEALGL